MESAPHVQESHRNLKQKSAYTKSNDVESAEEEAYKKQYLAAPLGQIPPVSVYNQPFHPPVSHCGYPSLAYPSLKRTGSLSSGSDSAFSPVRSSKSDEYQVTSTTEKSGKRSRSPSPRNRYWEPRTPSPKHRAQHKPSKSEQEDILSSPTHTTSAVLKKETVAATSTTSSEEDDERLRMQKQAGRGRRGAIGVVDHRPPSCGTPLGKIAEECKSGSSPGKNYPRETNKDRDAEDDCYAPNKDEGGVFRTPAAPADPQARNGEQFPQGYGVDPKFHVQPHIPLDSKIRDGRYPFDPRQLSMHGDPLGSSPVLSDIPLIPMSPHASIHPPVNGAPGLFMGPGLGNPVNNASLDLYMRSLNESPTMSILSQARGLSPRHSLQGGDADKFPYQYYGAQQANAAAALAASLASAGMGAPQNGVGTVLATSNPSQVGQPQSSLNTMAYYQIAAQQQSWLAAAAAAGASGNASMDRSLAMSFDRNGDLSRLSSPFYNRSRQGRKRALSISPSHSDISLDMIIRTSPNSLLPFTNSLGNSRASSIGSAGSYGHLGARGISPSLGFHHRMASPIHSQFFSRQMAAAAAVSGAFSPATFAGFAGQPGAVDASQQRSIGASFPVDVRNGQMPYPPGHLQMQGKQAGQQRMPVGLRGDFENTPGAKAEHTQAQYRHGMIKTEPQSPAVTAPNRGQLGMNAGQQRGNNDETETVYETNCGWENCSREFDTQEQLVHHINNDHIHGEKKEFVCRWRDCARDQKPFKAQYMLVVHMRRHTGEKPHRCSFEGCTKAYSRLENLKTHLRSHTGEKPYVCEFPGCTKAFSNASDRAKHQNRTHSSEKPYVCKIPNCTKRYTDPSSLRKHVKTVHGPDAHVTKRMKAERKREETKKPDQNDEGIKQEIGSNDHGNCEDENNNSKSSCKPSSPRSNHQSNDPNTPSNMNPRSNQSTCTSGSDMSTTPQHSPHANPNHQNNDSGVELNAGHGHDSDGDIVVDENPQPDSTSDGGVGVQVMRRRSLRSHLIPRMVNQKMQSLSIGAGGLPPLGSDYILPSLPGTKTEKSTNNSPYPHYSPRDANSIGGGTDEVSSTTLPSPKHLLRPNASPHNKSSSPHVKTQLGGISPLYRQVAMLGQDRRDSGTSSGQPSRKPSGVSTTSRRSSQNSSQHPAVAGSYDPISLGSSRKSSGISVAPGNAAHSSSSNLPGLNAFQLHRLTSKFNEVTGKPPPTPLDRETYTRSQIGKWLQEDVMARANGNLSNPSNVPQSGYNANYAGTSVRSTMGPPVAIPPPHPANHTNIYQNRRQSDAPFRRNTRTPLPHEIPSNANRRASDPVKKPSQQQVDPSRLPNVQRYYSWNNVNPLPGIRNYNNGNQMNVGGMAMHGMPGNPPYLSAGNLQAGRQRSDSNGSFISSESGYQSNGSNIALNNAGDYHQMMAQQREAAFQGQQSFYPNQMTRHFSQRGQNMNPQGGVDETLLQENLNADMMMSGMDGVFPNDAPYGNSAAMNAASINAQRRQMYMQQQQNANDLQPMFQPGYGQQQSSQFLQSRSNSNAFMNNDVYGNSQMPPYGDSGPPRPVRNSSRYMERPMPPTSMATYAPYSTAQNNLSSVPQQVQSGMYPPSSQPYCTQGYNTMSNQEMLTPRPPVSTGQGANAHMNRFRMNRFRNSNQRAQPTSSTDAQGQGRINYTPDAEIPDAYLQQEFIDSIPALHVSGSFDDKVRTSTKMPADSTTDPECGDDPNGAELKKPDGDVEDNFDAMSGTNTDVTLPSMSGLSTRLTTPLLEKPYSTIMQQQATNEQLSRGATATDPWDINPSANMALNSMSSMLSTLAEENKFLQMLPK